MVIGMGGCDNVEWGGIDISIVPPPGKADADADADTVRVRPDGPVLFYVHRDEDAATVIPVGQIADGGLAPLTPGDDPDAFADDFIESFLTPGSQLTLFRRGQRVGTLTVDSAAVPHLPVCRPLPRATGQVALATEVGAVTEFLAMPQARAPESQPGTFEAERRMEVVSDMLAGEMFRERNLAVRDPGLIRRQLQPFPLTGSPDPGFTATYLVDDSLAVGGDNQGAALFVVFTPRGQTGYNPAFTGFTEYAVGGKAAPRVIDFLDWDTDGAVALLLEVLGTHTSWFRAVGLQDGEWRAIFEQRCDPRTAPTDTSGAIDTGTQQGTRRPTPQPTQPRAPRPTTRALEPDLDSIPIIEPQIQLSNPQAGGNERRDPSVRDTTPPDTGSARPR